MAHFVREVTLERSKLNRIALRLCRQPQRRDETSPLASGERREGWEISLSGASGRSERARDRTTKAGSGGRPAGATHLPFPHHQFHLRLLGMGKRCRTARLEWQTTDSNLQEFRVDYEQTKHLATGEAIFSDAFSSGGYMWRVRYFPNGLGQVHKDHVSILFELVSKASVNAIFEAFIMGKDGHPWPGGAERTGVQLFEGDAHVGGWPRFVSHSDLEKCCLTKGRVTFVCAVMVACGSSIPVPASDIGKHFSAMLDSMDGADVSFTVDDEKFRAHRAVLAARSPVFKAELLGSMAEAAMPNITLHDIAPATFRVMLRFMYTDALPADGELGDSPTEMMQHLLAAADRYALDRLKLICAQKLWEDVSVDTVAATLSVAEMYSCPELKNRCIGFFATGGNFKKAVLTKGFVQLVQQFPSIVDELRERIGL